MNLPVDFRKKFSVVTAVYNGEAFLRDCMDSVTSQDYPNIEYVLIDGASKDKTLEIIKSFGDKVTKVISEKDRGIYDAINKGIKLCTGEYIAILNSDDVYWDPHVLSEVADIFEKTECDMVFGDVLYTKRESLQKPVRYYSSKNVYPWMMRLGYMPAHPATFVRKSVYDKYGLFNPDFRISGDFDFLLRTFGSSSVKFQKIEKPLVRMRQGGISSSGLKSVLVLNREILRSCRHNSVWTHYPLLYSRYFTKVFQWLIR